MSIWDRLGYGPRAVVAPFEWSLVDPEWSPSLSIIALQLTFTWADWLRMLFSRRLLVGVLVRADKEVKRLEVACSVGVVRKF